MIGYLEGSILSKSEDSNSLLILCQNIGYEVAVPKSLFESIVVSEPKKLWIHTHVREDILALYGFGSEGEKQTFKLLISVSGLGPKTAMNLISEHGPNLFQYIVQKDISAITKASGVGKKLAEKIILELASKVEKISWVQLKAVVPSENTSMKSDLISALIHLGYSPNQVKIVVENLMFDETKMSFDQTLKLALQNLW